MTKIFAEICGQVFRFQACACMGADPRGWLGCFDEARLRWGGGLVEGQCEVALPPENRVEGAVLAWSARLY
jgi:hypothetical protein